METNYSKNYLRMTGRKVKESEFMYQLTNAEYMGIRKLAPFSKIKRSRNTAAESTRDYVKTYTLGLSHTPCCIELDNVIYSTYEFSEINRGVFSSRMWDLLHIAIFDRSRQSEVAHIKAMYELPNEFRTRAMFIPVTDKTGIIYFMETYNNAKYPMDERNNDAFVVKCEVNKVASDNWHSLFSSWATYSIG